LPHRETSDVKNLKTCGKCGEKQAAVYVARGTPVEMQGQTLRIRFHEALYVLYILLYVKFACAAAEASNITEVWNKTQLLELYSKWNRPARHICDISLLT